MIPTHLKVKWAIRLPLAVIAILSAYFIVPIASLFTRQEVRTDTMKRKAREKGKPEYTQFTEMRTYLHPAFNWYQTHDNAQDEFYEGGYEDFVNKHFTRADYDKYWLLRYYNLVRWGWRNAAYTFRYEVLGVPQSFDEPSVFKDGDKVLYVWDEYFLYESNGNKTGWNSHRSAPILSHGRKNVMFAIK